MKIKRIISQHRRDFRADFECHCGHIEKNISGYDDRFFHTNVIPSMKCEKCGETAKDAPEEYRALSPKYAANQQV